MKKWTYLVAALLTLGSTSVLTGCIDNDEPAGISALRTAKAELIAAKKAVEEAKAAETLANAALIQAQVKTEEANAAKIQAEAEIAKAEAAIKQAEADKIAAQTETERANAQAIIEANERAQKEWEEYAAVRAAQAEAAIAEAEARIARAKADYQAAIASLLTSQTNALLPYVNDLNLKLTAYYNALDALIAAQRDLNDQQKVVDDNEANKELMTRQLQLGLATAEATLEGAQKAQTEAEATLEEAQALQASELAGKYEEYKELSDNFNLQIADLSVEAAEKIYELYTSGRVAEVLELREKHDQYFDNSNNSEEDEVTLDALVMDHGNGTGLPDLFRQGEVERYPETSCMSRAEFYYNYELNVKPSLESIVEDYRSLTRDANDNEWTADRIAILEAELKNAEDSKATLVKSWKEAVSAYQAGKYNNNIGDYTAISGYTAVSTALAAYNAEIVALNALYKDIKGYEDAEDAAFKAREKARTDAITALANARSAALTAFQSSKDNLSTLFATRQSALKKVYDDAKAETDAAMKAYEESTSIDAAVLAALYRVYLDKKKVSDEAYTAYINYRDTDTLAEIEKVRDDAIAAANKACDDAVAAATKAYDDAWEVGKGTQRLLWDKAAADANDRENDFYNDFIDPLQKAIVAYNKNLPELTEGYPEENPINSYEPQNNFYAWTAPGRTRKELTEATLFQLHKSSLKDVVILRSIALYGAGYNENPYGDPEARLVELSDDAIKSELKADETLTNYRQYYNAAQSRYGAAGKVIALKAQIELAQSWLNNGEQIKKLIAQAEDYLAEFDALYEEIETTEETMWDAYEAADKKLDADKLATLEPILAKQAELQPLQHLYDAYTNALGAYVANASNGVTTDLESWIQTCETAIDNAKLAVYNAETAVMQAKKDLEDWNAGDLTILEMKQRAVEDAQTKVDRAKEAMDKAQAALDAAIALFETAE